MKEGKPSYEDLVAKIHIQEYKMNKARRLYHFISRMNKIIVRAKDRNQLFRDVCKLAVEVGDFQMAWVGMIDHVTQDVLPVTVSGHHQGYLSLIKKISVKSDHESGRGPVGIAIRKGLYQVCNAIDEDPMMEL